MKKNGVAWLILVVLVVMTVSLPSFGGAVESRFPSLLVAGPHSEAPARMAASGVSVRSGSSTGHSLGMTPDSSSSWYVAQTLVLFNNTLVSGNFLAQNGVGPHGVAYDSAKGEVFVVNVNSNNVSVISDATNTVVATVNVRASSSSPPPNSTSPTSYILIGVVVVVIAAIAGVMLMRKRAPPKRASTSPNEPGEDKAPERAEDKEDPS